MGMYFFYCFSFRQQLSFSLCLGGFQLPYLLLYPLLIVFSVLGIASPKLERWGIHFIPVYLWIIAMGATFWRWKLKSLPNVKVLKPFYYLMLAIALLQPSWLLFENHQLIVQKPNKRQLQYKLLEMSQGNGLSKMLLLALALLTTPS
jgi:hypothetical protein